MNELVVFSFALNPRIQSFLQLRDGLLALQSAKKSHQIHSWLQACIDLRASLLGEDGRRMALPELTALLASMRTQLEQLAEEHQQFRTAILKSCGEVDHHMHELGSSKERLNHLFSNDEFLDVYVNAIKKQDWLAHKLTLPQISDLFWNTNQEHYKQLSEALQPLIEIVTHLNSQLHDHVDWKTSVAQGGHEHIRMERDRPPCGLLIVGLNHQQVANGFIPEISGNRLAIRIRFQQWTAGHAIRQVTTDVPYQFMAVPVA